MCTPVRESLERNSRPEQFKATIRPSRELEQRTRSTRMGQYYWKVVYDGDSRNDGFDDCNENVDVTLTGS